MKTILIYSGGLDSTVLLYDLLNGGHKVECLHFKYGQTHGESEYRSALCNADECGCELRVCDIPFMEAEFTSELLAGDADAIPDGHYADESMRATVVPFRNGIMLSLAAGYAESVGASEVAIANHAGDHPIYPDCRPEFIQAMKGAILHGTDGKVALSSPFCKMSKADIVKRGAALSVPFEKTWSCYKGGDVHCGKCGTCVERKEAFALAGVKDETRYMDT